MEVELQPLSGDISKRLRRRFRADDPAWCLPQPQGRKNMGKDQSFQPKGSITSRLLGLFKKEDEAWSPGRDASLSAKPKPRDSSADFRPRGARQVNQSETRGSQSGGKKKK